MNATRRKAITAAIAKIAEGRNELEAARDEETDYYDNMPENMQQGEKGEKAQEAISALDDGINAIESAEQEIEAALS